MPIVDIEESRQLEFGHGDIFLAPGLLKTDDESIIGCVVFKNQEARPIGEFVKHDPPKEVELDETPCRMIFEKIESIDVVIKTLQDVKKMMANKTIQIY